MNRARTACVPIGTLRRYSPFSFVSTLRAVPTITTLTPASGAPDPAATTVPETVPVCCAASGEMTRRAAYSGRAGARLMCHLEDDGRDPGVAKNTPPLGRQLRSPIAR